ncbi:hypothetical protein PRK78_004492 [Emydomyces testavorans]|uniref:Secretory phospholipase A2 n=1 Tax=Emydomyces testavorans TaxID=2070801 RepID=A0AAF0ILP4_9EURO|nr:hypothetical protein PRK78_004492 [Emydomyces testavorans]
MITADRQGIQCLWPSPSPSDQLSAYAFDPTVIDTYKHSSFKLTMKLNAQPFVLLGLLTPVALTAPVADAPLSSRADQCTIALTDQYMFQDSIQTFEGHRNTKTPPCFDWSSDNCSNSPDRPAGFNFIPSCQRHDFGYRNTKKQGRFTEDLRKRIDDQFKADLYRECSQYSGLESWRGVECRRIADVYYAAVRQCGDGDCTNKV